eukprot:11537217-Alexandrium_andersonii.AAC.1
MFGSISATTEGAEQSWKASESTGKRRKALESAEERLKRPPAACRSSFQALAGAFQRCVRRFRAPPDA